MQLFSFRSHFSSALSLALSLFLSLSLSLFLLSVTRGHAPRLLFVRFVPPPRLHQPPATLLLCLLFRAILSFSFVSSTSPSSKQFDRFFFILCIFILRCFIFLSGVARSFLVQEEKKVHWNRGHHEIPALSRSAPPTIELSGFSSRRDQRKGDEIRSLSRNTGDASFSFFVRAGCIVSAPDVATSRCRRDHDQSFDETSMDSCPLAAITEARPGDLSKDGNEMEVTSLEEAKSVIAALRARQRAQAHQMLAWRRTLKLQEDLVARLTREKAEQLRTLSSQLLLFESRLCRKQKEIEASLAQRESIILRQQRVIRQLQSRLAERSTGTRDSPPCDALDRLDSLGDSDSAVVLEEAADDLAPPRFRSNITDVTVIRSVSDAVEPSSKYSSMRRCNGFLRRPEILETVYSVEEDGDSENNQDPSESTENSECEERRAKNLGNGKGRLQDLYGSFERLAQEADSPPNERPRDESQQAQVTYNRVMSNHRSVTKPKDVKYKRINKAKSKSLEELRGRLRNWVEKGNKIAISLDQSYA